MSHGRVLLIEDDADVRDVISAMLADLGYAVTACSNAEDGVESLGAGARFEVVVSDVMMPGTTGLELSTLVRRWLPRTPIVLVTGKQEALDSAVKSGYIPLLKPFTEDQLQAVLAEAMKTG